MKPLSEVAPGLLGFSDPNPSSVNRIEWVTRMETVGALLVINAPQVSIHSAHMTTLHAARNSKGLKALICFNFWALLVYKEFSRILYLTKAARNVSFT